MAQHLCGEAKIFPSPALLIFQPSRPAEISVATLWSCFPLPSLLLLLLLEQSFPNGPPPPSESYLSWRKGGNLGARGRKESGGRGTSLRVSRGCWGRLRHTVEFGHYFNIDPPTDSPLLRSFPRFTQHGWLVCVKRDTQRSRARAIEALSSSA